MQLVASVYWCFCVVVLMVNGKPSLNTSLEPFHFLNQMEPNVNHDLNDSSTLGRKYQSPYLIDRLNHDTNFASLTSLPDVVTDETVDDLIELFRQQNKSLVEIRGLPEEPNENLIVRVRCIATEIGFKDIFKILAVARLGTENVTAFPRIVLVLLDNVKAGYDLVMMYREYQKIRNIGKFNCNAGSKMFINECLTKSMRRLLFEVKLFCKKEGFAYKTKYGVISVMKPSENKSNGEKLQIETFQSLESLRHREVHKKFLNVLSNYYNHSSHWVQQLSLLRNLRNYSSMLQWLPEELPYELASSLCKPLRDGGQFAIEIVGMPEVPNVTTMNLVKAYAREIGVNHPNIRAAFRLAPEVWGQSGKPRAVFVVMGSQNAMNDMIRLCKSNNYSSNFSKAGYYKIYVNKFLSKEMKTLVYQTKGFCKSFHYSYVIRDDVIFVRDAKFGRNGTPIAISNPEELQKLHESKVVRVSNHTVHYKKEIDISLIKNNFSNYNKSCVPKSNKTLIEEKDEIKYNQLESVLARNRKQKQYAVQIQGLAENRSEHLLATVYRYLIVIGFQQVSKVVACYRIEKINASLPGPRDILAIVRHLNSKIEILLRSELHNTKLKLNAKQRENVTTSVVSIRDFPLHIHCANSSAINGYHQTARSTYSPLKNSNQEKRNHRISLNSDEKVKFLSKIALEKKVPIEFINIPEGTDENTLTIVHQYLTHIGLPYTSEITSAYRLENKEQQRNSPRVILAAVTSKAIRDEIIQVNRIHNLNARRSGKLLYKGPVEIDEHKTDFVKQLVLETQEFCNNTGFFVSDKGGVITVKDSEGRTQSIIKDYSDFQTFKDYILKEYFKPIIGTHNIDSYEVRSKETTLRSVNRIEDFGEEPVITI